MPRVVVINGIIDDGTPYIDAPLPALPIEAALGESLTLHLLLKTPSGKPIPATAQRVITYGARRRPLPFGQLLFQHIAVISPLGDGGWDCPIVPNDYRLIAEGSGRFPFDIWLSDNTVSPPADNPVQQLSPFIVTPTAISVVGPSTAPVPQPIIAYALPNPSPSGYILQALGFSGSVGQVAWVPPTLGTLPSGVNGQALFWQNGALFRQITQDDVAPAFSIALSGQPGVIEAGGSLVNQQYLATANQTPAAGTLKGPDGVVHNIPNGTLAQSMALGFGGAANTFPAQTFTDDGSTLNKVLSTVLSLTNAGGVNKQVTASTVCERRAYYGIAVPGTFNAGFVTALASSRLQFGFAGSYTFPGGDGTQFSYIALPTGWGNPSTFAVQPSNLPVIWSKVASGISVTNVNGVTFTFELWQSPQANLTQQTYGVS